MVTVRGTFASLVVVVLDAVGNRVPGQTVTFSAPQLGASAVASIGVLTTDSTGQASFTITANNIAGRYAVAISGSGIAAPALFALTTDQNCSQRLRDLREYAEARGWRIQGEYVDQISGTRNSLPAMNRLMEAAHRRAIDAVICWKIDRWGRSMTHFVSSV